jgi:hypothetical protein
MLLTLRNATQKTVAPYCRMLALFYDGVGVYLSSPRDGELSPLVRSDGYSTGRLLRA